jgi:hypothetical protein
VALASFGRIVGHHEAGLGAGLDAAIHSVSSAPRKPGFALPVQQRKEPQSSRTQHLTLKRLRAGADAMQSRVTPRRSRKERRRPAAGREPRERPFVYPRVFAQPCTCGLSRGPSANGRGFASSGDGTSPLLARVPFLIPFSFSSFFLPHPFFSPVSFNFDTTLNLTRVGAGLHFWLANGRACAVSLSPQLPSCHIKAAFPCRYPSSLLFPSFLPPDSFLSLRF